MGKTKGESVSLSFLNDKVCVIVSKLKGRTFLPINKLPLVENGYHVEFDKKGDSHFKLLCYRLSQGQLKLLII
jgi:hypothetical protein